MVQGTVEECLDRLDGYIYSHFEGLPALFLEDKPWSIPAIAIAQEVVKSHKLGIESFGAFITWIKDVENAARTYQLTGENVNQRIWLEKIPQKSLILTNGTSTSWSNVLVLGEIGIDCPYIVGFRNLCAHANEVFTHQPARVLHGFYISEPEGIMEMWVFDRAGIYESKAFDIQQTPELVTQIIASYLLMDDVSLGVSDLMKFDDRDSYIECEFGGKSEACQLYLDDSPIFARVDKSIISDGLTCYRARLLTDDDWTYAVKIKWCEPDESSEAKMLELVTEKHVWGVVRLIEHRIFCSTSDWRRALILDNTQNFSDRKKTTKQVGSSSACDYTSESQKGEGVNSRHTPKSEEKVLKFIVVVPLGKSLHRFESIPGLLYALRDALKGHRSFAEENPEETRDFLIDLDLATPVTSPSKQFESVGTAPFRAIGVLQAYLPNNPQTYRHDLESFFYTFLFLAICKKPVPVGENQLQLPAKSVLQRWNQGRPVDKARAKTEDMHVGRFRIILDEFTPDFKLLSGLAEEIRDLLFPLRDGRLWTGTDHAADGTSALYDRMIDAFDKATRLVFCP
ncbi:hypothetical protein N7540_000209 [Penicillium herquei]|nr:hypothetical protein N7540_000209 [Penicillium herquei]